MLPRCVISYMHRRMGKYMNNDLKTKIIDELHIARNKALVAKRALEYEALADPKHEFWIRGSKSYLLGKEHRGELIGLSDFLFRVRDDDFNADEFLDKARRDADQMRTDGTDEDKAFATGLIKALDRIEAVWKEPA